MKLKQLEQLERVESFKTLTTLTPLKEKSKELLSEIYLLNYISTILLQNTLIQRNEVTVTKEIKTILSKEMRKISKALFSENLQDNLSYTKKEVNSFYKKVGIATKI